MKNQITSRDYELLTAYLDNQLGSQERARLESRLNADPEFQKELHEIGKTRLLLRSLPSLKAPRNYFVSPELSVKPVAVRLNLRLAPAYGIVSAIATILLVLVIFGNRLLTSATPVALAPAPVASNESYAIQQEVQRSVSSTPYPTEAAPVVMMAAPELTSPGSPTAALKASESEIATPTTIYLYAYPPTSTPEISISIMSDQTVTATIPCEEYYRDQTLPNLTNCPTPTGIPSDHLQGILISTTPISSTIETSIPTITPILSTAPSTTPVLTDTPSAIQNIVPESGIEAPSLTAPSEQAMDAANPTTSGIIPTEIPVAAPNFDFMQYLVLAIELSLAAIAIIAGIIAIILRIRTGR
jgi:hypothetical protein